MSTDSLQGLLDGFIASDPRLEIWRHYPDITEEDDAVTDGWACESVSAQFAAFARDHGWDAGVVHGEDPETPMAADHVWVGLRRGETVVDVDWTARQYHNLYVEQGHDPRVLGLPWPLVWAPHAVAGNTHPVVGFFAVVTRGES